MTDQPRDLVRKSRGDLSAFERFAEASSGFCSRAPFFAACVALIVLWTPTIFFLDFNTSQLLINTATTIITFLLVALIQNSQKRAENAFNFKLNEIADALADLMEEQSSVSKSKRMRKDANDLREAVGIEQKVSA